MPAPDAHPTPDPRPAATVLMLRDGQTGPEVFMIQRHEKSSVHGGAYVFPGGKVDADDADAPDATTLDQNPARLRAMLNEPALELPAAAALYVAAIRETFEECGVLLVQDCNAGSARAVVDATARGQPFGAVLRSLGLTLSTRALSPWSRWITPVGSYTSRVRFDTRFFVIDAPADQNARHDDHEASNSVWITPRAALDRYWRGEIVLAPPQIMSLAHLAHHDGMAGILAEARSRAPYVVRPLPFEHEGIRAMAYPGDAQHEERVAVMPGPTRLVLRNGRFEPVAGFAGFFA